MSLVGVIAWVMLALLVGFLGLVVYATLRQLRGEVREAAQQRRL